jgi:D-alanyl-D-alanine carboxypeptidase
MCFAYWRSPHGKRAALAVAVTLAGAFFLLSTADADARSRKRQRTPGAWQAGFSAIVVDAKTGKILDDESPDALRHPASLTKIMTLYVLFERIEQGKVSLKTRLNVSEYASERPPSKLGLQPGTTIAVEDAIKALVTRSANDVATVIAENLADDEEEFGALMTKKARALGMSNTVFKNASGLPDREMVTTARDMATLGRAIQDRFPSLYRYFSTQSFVWRGRVIANHNRLLGRVPGVDGIKTGYTNASGFNLVTSVRHKNRHIVAVVLGGRTGALRDQYMRELIADNLDDATAGPRTTPLIAEAPTPSPKRVAQAPAKNSPNPKEQKPQVVRAAQPKKPQPVVVAGSNQPIRPIPVKTTPLDAEGKIRHEAETVQAGVFAYSNLSASNVAAVAIVRNAGQKPVVAAEQKAVTTEQKPVVIADLPLKAQYQVAPVVGALAFSDNKPHPLAESPRLQPQQVQAQKPVNELSETEELEIEAQALASAKEDNLSPVAASTKNPSRGPQIASTNSIPASAVPVMPATNDDGDPLPPAAKSGWSIQIGAFPNARTARERLQDVKDSATALLAKATPYTEKVSKDSTNLFRARFAGFRSEWHARRVCQTLQQRDVDCIVAKN